MELLGSDSYGTLMRKITLLLSILLSWLQYSLWLGKNGIYDLIHIQNDVNLQQCNNAKLKARNDLLFVEIQDLSHSREAIEERSRNELGMIKSGETFYRLVPEQSQWQSAVSITQDN